MATQALASPPSAALPDDGFITPKEAAAILRLSTLTIYGLMNRGELRSCRFGKARRIPRSGLAQYIERCTDRTEK